MSDDNRILDRQTLRELLSRIAARSATTYTNQWLQQIDGHDEALRAALDTAEARERNAWDAVQSKEARLLGAETALKQMTRERDTAWRMYLEQLDESADVKTAHELAEARVAELTRALADAFDLIDSQGIVRARTVRLRAVLAGVPT